MLRLCVPFVCSCVGSMPAPAVGQWGRATSNSRGLLMSSVHTRCSVSIEIAKQGAFSKIRFLGFLDSHRPDCVKFSAHYVRQQSCVQVVYRS